jgi:hypothetical protein
MALSDEFVARKLEKPPFLQASGNNHVPIPYPPSHDYKRTACGKHDLTLLHRSSLRASDSVRTRGICIIHAEKGGHGIPFYEHHHLFLPPVTAPEPSPLS